MVEWKLKLVDVKELKENSYNSCSKRKCYKCHRFRNCALLNDGGGLFAENLGRRRRK